VHNELFFNNRGDYSIFARVMLLSNN